MGFSLRDVVDFIIGLVALSTPLGRLVYILYMISTHMKEIESFSKKAGNWVHKQVQEISPTSADLHRNSFGLENLTFGKLSELFNLYFPKNGVQASSRAVTMSNTFNISSNHPHEVAKHVSDALKHSLNKSAREQTNPGH